MKREIVTKAIVDLDSIVQNYTTIQRLVGGATVYPVLKGNAYGHGAIALSRILYEVGCRSFAVAKVDEARELRMAGIPRDAEIMVMTVTLPEELLGAVETGASMFIGDIERLRYLKSIGAGRKEPVRYHVKVDTGMGRIGFMPWDHGVVKEFLKDPGNTQLVGIASHLAASWLSSPHNQKQYERFIEFVEGVNPPPGTRLHIAASSGTLRFADMYGTAVRCGGLIYGLSRVDGPPVELLPALTYKTRVGQVRHLPAGWHIGYGTNQWVEKPVTTATLPVGHGDGLASSMAGKLDFLVNQKRCRLLAVCADNCMIDISGALPVSTGDEVVIVGRQGNDAIMAREIIDKSDTGYGEFFGKISLRTPRIYMMGGQQVGEMSFVACTGIARRGR